MVYIMSAAAIQSVYPIANTLNRVGLYIIYELKSLVDSSRPYYHAWLRLGLPLYMVAQKHQLQI